jgi:hypothetical protein
MHKEGVPLRPTVSNIGAPTYQLSKYLAGLLSQLTGNLTHHIKISLQCIQILESVRLQPDDLMGSFDVVSLFTKVPFTDTIELISHHFEDDVLSLFKHVLASTYFCFEENFTNKLKGWQWAHHCHQ